MKKKFRSEYFLLSLIIVISAILFTNNWLWMQRIDQQGNDLNKIIDKHESKLALFENKIDLYQLTGNFFYLENIHHEAKSLNRLMEVLPKGGSYQHDNYSIVVDDYSLEKEDSYKKLVSHLQKMIKTTDQLENSDIKDENYNLGGTNRNKETQTTGSDEINTEALKSTIASVLVNLDKIQKHINTLQEEKIVLNKILIVILQILATVIIVFTYFYFKKKIFNPARNITSFAQNLAEGRTEKENESTEKSDLFALDNSLHKLSRHISDATSFAINIGEGKVDEEIEVTEDDMLGKALLEMRDKLKDVAEEERKRNWAVNGMAKFSEILRQYQHSEINELSYQFIFALVKYLEGNQGGVFLINEEEDEKYIELAACYAYERRKKLHTRLEMEEGLIGQCIIEKDLVYIEDVPEDYINITSGLGKKTPTCILIAPIKVNEEIFGAVELAFFNFLPQYKKDFVTSVCETFGSSLSSSRMNMRTRKLLENSQSINAELQEKEEEMRQNAEELETTQEELNRKLSELSEETNLSQNIVEAINKTNATIEFDLEGNILEVNDMYVSVMGYSKPELIGTNEKALVPKDELDSNRYQMLWQSLISGSFMSGEYRRVSKGGREVWLNGTYNPIFDLHGKPYKVIQFAQFTTEEKEKDLDLSSKINAISSTFPLIELDLERKIKSSNQEFINLFGYKRLEVRNKELQHLIDDENDNHKMNQNLSLEEAIDTSKTTILPIKTKDGVVKYCLTICSPIKNLAGEVYKIMIILVDVTEQKKLEMELIKNQEILSETIGELKNAKQYLLAQKNEIESRINMLNMAASIFELDKKGVVTMANSHFYQNFKVDENSIEGKSFYEFIDPDFDISTVDEMWKNVNEGKIVRNTISVQFNNKFWIDVTVAPILDGKKQPYKFIGIISDITNQVKRETTLREDLAKERVKNTILSLQGNEEDNEIASSFAQLTKMLDGDGQLNYEELMNKLPTFHIDKEGIINKISKEAEKVLGVKANNLKGKGMHDLISLGDPEEQKTFMKKLTGGMVVKQPISLQINKNEVALDLISLPVFSEKTNGMSILMFFNKKEPVA